VLVRLDPRTFAGLDALRRLYDKPQWEGDALGRTRAPILVGLPAEEAKRECPGETR
jgi:hypothetical protein